MRNLLSTLLAMTSIACATAAPRSESASFGTPAAPIVRTYGATYRMGALNTFMRGRDAQMHFCYEEYGLKVNPKLAGKVVVAVTITESGMVDGVDITERSWSGKESEDVENCMRSKIRSWKFPAEEKGGGTYPFSYIFTK
jgi:hypothetical protein